MADINSITSAAQYRGDPNLGGALGIGITIDPAPIQRLQNFMYYRDKDLYEQKQRDDATAARQIANIAAFDITSPLPVYGNALKDELKGIQDFVRANPDALVYSRNPQKFQELQNKIGRFSTVRQTATASDAVYAARKAAIDKESDPLKRSVMQKELDLDVNDLLSGGLDASIGKVLKSVPDLKIEDAELPNAKVTEYTVIDEGPNKDIKNKFKFINLDQLRAESELLAAGAGANVIDENASWFRNLSPERKQLEREKRSITSAQRQKIAKLSTDFNALLTKFKQSNPNVDFKTITGQYTGDTLLDNIRSANEINKQIDELNTLIAGGTLKDPTGRVITKKYDKFNLEDGLSEAEIIMMNALQKSKSPLWSLDKEIQQTDNALQTGQQAETRAENRRDNALAWFNAQTGRMNAAKSGSGTGSLETTDVMDLTGYTGSPSNLSISDMAAINPSFVTSENGVLKLTTEGKAARSTIKILPNGDVSFEEEEDYTDTDGKEKSRKVTRTVAKNVYQKQAVTHVQTILKDRKGEEGNPFTNTGKKKPASNIPEYSKSDLLAAKWTEAQIKIAVDAGKIKLK